MNIHAAKEASNDPLMLNKNEGPSSDFSCMLSEMRTSPAGSSNKRRAVMMHQDAPSSKRTKLAYRRVRCKARGMSESHNSTTAYFEIPANAPHGLLLCCSHPECQASNRKFRFCKECDVPVAKRNFIRRHGHGLVTSTKALKENVDNARINFVERTGCLPVDTPFTPMMTMTNELEQLRCRAVSPSSVEEGDSWAAASAHQPEAQQYHQAPRSSFATATTPPEQYSRHQQQQHDQVLSDNEQQWLSLLRSRPVIDDTASMMTWVGQVLEHANVPRSDGAFADDMPHDVAHEVSEDDLEESLNLFFAGNDDEHHVNNQCQSI